MHRLTQKISALQQRLVVRERGVAACRIAAAVLAAALVLGLVDYVVQYSDPGLQIMATAALVTAAAWAAWRWWYRRRRRLVPLMVARRIEARFPQLHDRLASALEFLQQSEDDRTAGSAQLRRLVVAEAELAVDSLPLEEIIDRRPLRRAAAWLAVPLLALAMFVALDARAVGTALARLVVPLGAVEWPRQHYLAFLDVPTRLAAGQRFEVELIDEGGELPEEVRMEYRTLQDGRRSFFSEPMTRAGHVMVARRDEVRRSFDFRAAGGDDDTMRWHHVEVVEPPRIESLEISVHPPAYTGEPARPADRHLQVLAGTGIEMRGHVNRPITAARILLEGAPPIAASVDSSESGGPGHTFHIAPTQWIAARSSPYRLELTDGDGTAVVVGEWNLRVEPDPPPTVAWQRPSGDLAVLTSAVVPVELVVQDNLAVARVALVYERSDRSEAELEREPAEPPIVLHRSPKQPAAQSSGSASGENRRVEYVWELAPLELPPGAALSAHAEAADYRPGVGRTIVPRRIEIVTPQELDEHFAERLTQIVRQLERSLAVQRATRGEVRRLEIDQRHAALDAADRNALEAAELNQRRVGRMLADPAEGVPALVDGLVAEMEMNGVAGSELASLVDRLATELSRLASGPLDVAERELTAARKAVAAPDPAAAEPATGPLAAAGAAQEEVLATIEQLINELSDKADFRRFERLLAALRDDQLAHQQASRQEIGIATRPLRLDELTRSQRASLNTASAEQSALAVRLQKIETAMDTTAAELTDEDSEAAGALFDAVEMARRLAIGFDMREAAQEFADNRVGQALERQTQIAAELQQVLDVLRRKEAQQPERLLDKLAQAEQQLAALREDLTALRRQTAEAEPKLDDAASQREQELLQQRQAALRRDIEQLARQLAGLQADDAAASTQSAADRLKHPAGKERERPTQHLEQAEQDLEEAARQLAARRQQAEDNLALEFVRRFEEELGQMVKRQQRVLETTRDVESRRTEHTELDDPARQSILQMAAEERRLAEMAHAHSELLFGLASVRISLEEAERRLAIAAELLEKLDTGPAAQRAERHALGRLDAMLQAFAQTAREAGQNQPPPPQQPPQAANGNQPQRRPTFELLEVKMLRMLQADLGERTERFRQRLAEAVEPTGDERAELQQEAHELASEQGRLAELVETMLSRDNEE